MTELYLVRHGETELNAKGVYYGWTDCSLNDKGIRQAEELAVILAEAAFDVVISSPLCRALETAIIVSGFDRSSIIVDERLRELNFGGWEGLHYEEVRENHRELWENWGRDWRNAAPPSGESFRELYNRVKECMGEILREYENRKILLVAHQGCLRIIPTILLKMEEDGYWNFTSEQGRYSLFHIESGHCTVVRLNSGK